VKIICFTEKAAENPARARYRIGALVNEKEAVDLTPLFSKDSLSAADMLDCYDLSGKISQREHFVKDAPRIELSSIDLTCPVPVPGKIICIGLNYRDHAEESGMPIPETPIIFSKFSNCAIASEQPIRIPSLSSKVDYEAELAAVIGRRCKSVDADDAMDHVFGYMNFNDVSARDFQFADGQWQRGKSCDTFAPMGPFIAMADEIPDPHNLRIQFRLNGDSLQDSNTDQLIFNIPALIEFISESITLEPGDIIATGTPPGVGFARTPPIFMKDGDIAEVEIDGLGILSNPVQK
jgi:2-keto-4-pentenoate hydratase/2-oxohepta-3-ene-1,7-dioic acid hydratase in catechol pathway